MCAKRVSYGSFRATDKFYMEESNMVLFCRILVLAISVLLLGSCGSEELTKCSEDKKKNEATGECESPSYTVTGKVKGLKSGKSVKLEEGTGGSVTVSSDGSFTLPNAIPDKLSYLVYVSTQPEGKPQRICIVDNAQGEIKGADVANVEVDCSGLKIFTKWPGPSGKMPGALGDTGIARADKLCEAYSDGPNDGATYKAMLVDGSNRIACKTANCSGGASEHSDWVLQADQLYIESANKTAVGKTTSSGIFSFPLRGAIDWRKSFDDYPWTGLQSDWTTSSSLCVGEGKPWNSSTEATNGAAGFGNSTDATAIFAKDRSCFGIDATLICVEQP